MKKSTLIGCCLIAAFALVSWSHKFYVGIYQLNFAPEKRMLQVTTRIFVDDLNEVLEKKYKRTFHLAEPNPSQQEIGLMNQYLNEKFQIAVNGKSQPLDYRSFEIEGNVIVGYYRLTGIAKINSLAVTNKVLFDLVTEQQNIIQTTVEGTKKNLLLSPDQPSGTLTF